MPRNIIIENKKKLIALKKLFVHKTRLVTVTVEYRNRGILRLRLPYRGYRRILKNTAVLSYRVNNRKYRKYRGIPR